MEGIYEMCTQGCEDAVERVLGMSPLELVEIIAAYLSWEES